MAAPEQSNLVGPQHQCAGFIGYQHGFRIDSILIINGGGDEVLKGGNTLGNLARKFVIVLPEDFVSDIDRVGLLGTNPYTPGWSFIKRRSARLALGMLQPVPAPMYSRRAVIAPSLVLKRAN